MLKCISEKGLSKPHKVLVENFPVGTSNIIVKNLDQLFRGSHQRCSIKKDVLKNFTKLTGKHLCQSLFFDKAAGLRQQNTSGRLFLIVKRKSR